MQEYTIPGGRCLRCQTRVQDTRVLEKDNGTTRETVYACSCPGGHTRTYCYSAPYGKRCREVLNPWYDQGGFTAGRCADGWWRGWPVEPDGLPVLIGTTEEEALIWLDERNGAGLDICGLPLSR